MVNRLQQTTNKLIEDLMERLSCLHLQVSLQLLELKIWGLL